jgi:hypothetical protein
MNHDGIFSIATAARLCALGFLATCASPAAADLVNKYTFNNNTANDSIGGQHGTVIDNTGISKYTGGAIDLTGNGDTTGSNQDFSLPTTVGTYVDLPNGIFTAAVNNGAPGAVTLEVWATPQVNRNWARIADFGTSDQGEGFSTGGGNSSYVIIVPQNGIGGANDHKVTASTHSPGNESFLFGNGPLTPGVRHHVVLTLDHLDNSAGANGTAKLYVDNGAPVISPIVNGIFLDSITDNNNWLGRAQWGDPLFDGLIDEFRIYSHALSQAEVSSSFATGPEPAPLPVLVVNRSAVGTTGAISLANQTAGNVQIKSYSVTSASGSLNPATWTSIDALNAFDPDGTWATQSLTSTNITESVTGGNLDGGTLAPSTSRGIGQPWRKTPFEDLVFNFTLGDGTTGSGLVQYTGSPAPRSDLNGDSLVTAADWSLFLPHSFTSFPGDLAVAAYLKGDLDGDKDNDYVDFILFRADYNAANGAGSFAALLSGVPEPSSLALVAMTFAVLLGIRRDRMLG